LRYRQVPHQSAARIDMAQKIEIEMAVETAIVAEWVVALENPDLEYATRAAVGSPLTSSSLEKAA